MAKTILKTYEVTYILGTINPETRTIKISSINDLTEDFIKSEILRQRPHQKNQIGSILSTLLVEEKVFGEEVEERQPSKDNKEIPVFNW
jgi:transcriptional regulatory protein LevR